MLLAVIDSFIAPPSQLAEAKAKRAERFGIPIAIDDKVS